MMKFNDDENTLLDSGGSSVYNMEKVVRLGFIRKVYGILTIQLLATSIVCALAMKLTASDPVVDPVHPDNSYYVLSFGSFLVASSGFRMFIFIFSLIVLISLFCFRQSYPMNMIMLSVWTVAMSMSVAAACASSVCDPIVVDKSGALLPLSLSSGPAHLPAGSLQCAVGTDLSDRGSNAVIMAAGITAIIFFSLTAFTMQSKWDFSFLGAGLGVALMCLFLWGIFISIFGGGANVMYLYALAGSVIFSLYIVYDTYLVMQVLGPDEYIMAAINLYLDIINLFIMILSLLNRRD